MRMLQLVWLLFLIPLFQILSSNELFLVSSQCLKDQESLLLQFRGSLQFNSTLSKKLTLWNQQSLTDCCKWGGVKCDTSGHVIELELDDETISSGIENSSALFSLRYLERLNLAYNKFNSTQIPVGMYNLANLTYLNLSNAGFVGQIPMGLSRMRRLVTLDLSTQFPGIQPLKLENPNLGKAFENSTELRELYLDGVDLSADMSEWCQSLSSVLPNLTVLSLRTCRISGPIDESLSELHFLSVIRLDQNNLSTTVPEFFASFSNLTTLTLASCNLQGAFPEKIFQVQVLQNLDLANNKLLSGTIPEFLPNESLRTISLSFTNFSGLLPMSISNLHNLSRIELSSCKFGGQIPTTMASLASLVYLDFSFNNFTGFIPILQLSKKLIHIDFSRNGLLGPISSEHFAGLSELVYINLANNLLNGSIPNTLFELPSLQKLFLSNNHFGGRVNEFGNASFSVLDTIDLSNNILSGSIPKSLFEVKRLIVLSLSSNSFSGPIQLDLIKRFHNLTRLELSYNNLTIDTSSSNSTSLPFPQFRTLKLASCQLQKFPDLKNQSRMEHLDLSSNQIQGAIPNWVWGVGNGSLMHLNLSCNLLEYLERPYNISSKLGVFDLHFNRLKGDIPIPPLSAIYVDYSSNHFSNSIPPEIGYSFASFLSLANNSLAGEIPESICNATYLQVLDFSRNSLSGSIPPCLMKKCDTIGVLNLGRNNLSGSIPDYFPVNCVLKTLDLGRNSLLGQIPGSLVNCTSLEVVNVGTNKLEDNFPCLFKNLSSLRVLVLRSNNFHGDLHCYQANHIWQNLQIIDIASNSFSGNISPKCLLNWRGMKEDEALQSGHNHLAVPFFELNKLYYQDTVTVTMKGMEMELVKILTVFTSIDFSDNKFEGLIPDTVGELKSLYVLNLSHNSLTGSIPKSIGQLTMLGSLDLSVNQLSGEIPEQLAYLTYLGFLNLSTNRLFGKIPTGSQLQTFSEDSYIGNAGLCGFPLNSSCEASEPTQSSNSPEDSAYDWKFIFIGVGYGVGAAIGVAPLFFCKRGSKWCDKHLEKMLKLIFPRFGFTYTRYDSRKVVAEENLEDDTPDDSEDSDFDYDEDEIEAVIRGSYCVYCSKLDFYRKKAIHNPKCTCHIASPVTFSSIPSPSAPLLVIYHQKS